MKMPGQKWPGIFINALLGQYSAAARSSVRRSDGLRARRFRVMAGSPFGRSARGTRSTTFSGCRRSARSRWKNV